MAHTFAHSKVARLIVRGTAPDGRPTDWKRHYFIGATFEDAAKLAYRYANELDKAKRADAETGSVTKSKLEEIPKRRRIQLMDRKLSGTLSVPEDVAAPIVHADTAPAAPTMPNWSDLEV